MAETPYENEDWLDLIVDDVQKHEKFDDCFKKRTVELTTDRNIPYVPKIIRQLRTWYVRLAKEKKEIQDKNINLVIEKGEFQIKVATESKDLNRQIQNLNHSVQTKGNTQLKKKRY